MAFSLQLDLSSSLDQLLQASLAKRLGVLSVVLALLVAVVLTALKVANLL